MEARVVVGEEDDLEKEFVVLDVPRPRPAVSVTGFAEDAVPLRTSTTQPVRVTEQTRSFLRASRDNVREEESTTTETSSSPPPMEVEETLKEEDVNEELVELEEAYNVREADEAEERVLLDLLRTSGERSFADSAPKFQTEEELLMEIVASENFGMDENPFNDSSFMSDEVLAATLHLEEMEQAARYPHYNQRNWMQEQREERLRRERRLQSEEFAQQRRELRQRIDEETKKEVARQEEVSRLLNLFYNNSFEKKRAETLTDAPLDDLPTIVTWGKDRVHGCLGRNSKNSEEGAQPIEDLPIKMRTRFTQVDVGKTHTVALTETGDVWTWGSNLRGQLGNGETGRSYIKPQMSLLSGITIRQIACGALHTVCVTDTGKVIAFGDNSCGQLGVSVANGEARATPVVVKGIQGLNAVRCAAGDYHTAVITDSGNLYTFGADSEGQLGLGDQSSTCDRPTLVLSLHQKGVRSVACGAAHTIAIVGADSQVWVWGCTDSGRLGLGDGLKIRVHRSPVLNEYLSGKSLLQGESIVKIACGAEHSLALTSKGRLFAWGAGRYGQTGCGALRSLFTPKPITSLTDVVIKDIACGEYVSAAVSESGELYTWGMGRNFQLGAGIGVASNEAHPTVAQQLANRCIRQVSCGAIHSAAIVERLSVLASAMASIFDNKEAHPDIVLLCDGKKIYCHRAILSLRCLYFRAFLQKAPIETSPSLIAINISNVGYLPLFYLIKFLYTESAAFPSEYLEEVIAIAKKMSVPNFEERIKDQKAKTMNRERLAIELVSLINNPTFSDIVFTFEQEPGRKLYAHKAILLSRSTHFANMFRWNAKSHEVSATKQDSTKREEISMGCSFDAMVAVLHHLYGASAKITGDNVVELFSISQLYSLSGLKAACEETMIDGLDTENVLALAQLAALHDAANLRNACVKFVASNFEQIVNPKNKELYDEWTELKQSDRKLAAEMENTFYAQKPKVRQAGNPASWTYWDAKMKEEENDFEEEDDEEDYEEGDEDEDEDEDDVKAKPVTLTKGCPSVSLVLRRVRESITQSPNEIAFALKMKESDWRIYESGKVVPPRDFWRKLEAYLRRIAKGEPLVREFEEFMNYKKK